jgi:hypothetical protein
MVVSVGVGVGQHDVEPTPPSFRSAVVKYLSTNQSPLTTVKRPSTQASIGLPNRMPRLADASCIVRPIAKSSEWRDNAIDIIS